MTALGANLKRLRKERSIKQYTLAAALGIARSTLCQYESGERTPSDELKLAIADYFGVTVDQLLREAPQALTLSQRERQLIAAYRAHPAMQPSVDRLLGLEAPSLTLVAAQGGDKTAIPARATLQQLADRELLIQDDPKKR